MLQSGHFLWGGNSRFLPIQGKKMFLFWNSALIVKSPIFSRIQLLKWKPSRFPCKITLAWEKKEVITTPGWFLSSWICSGIRRHCVGGKCFCSFSWERLCVQTLRSSLIFRLPNHCKSCLYWIWGVFSQKPAGAEWKLPGLVVWECCLSWVHVGSDFRDRLL